MIAGVDSPSRYLPSDATQRARLAACRRPTSFKPECAPPLPTRSIDVKPSVFTPFIADAEHAREAPLLSRADLRGTSMGLAVDALLTQHAGRWSHAIAARARYGNCHCGSMRSKQRTPMNRASMRDGSKRPSPMPASPAHSSSI